MRKFVDGDKPGSIGLIDQHLFNTSSKCPFELVGVAHSCLTISQLRFLLNNGRILPRSLVTMLASLTLLIA